VEFQVESDGRALILRKRSSFLLRPEELEVKIGYATMSIFRSSEVGPVFAVTGVFKA
jgi:hypothetical protein